MPDLQRKWPRQEKGGAGAKTQQEGPGQYVRPGSTADVGAGLKHLLSMTADYDKSSRSFLTRKIRAFNTLPVNATEKNYRQKNSVRISMKYLMSLRIPDL